MKNPQSFFQSTQFKAVYPVMGGQSDPVHPFVHDVDYPPVCLIFFFIFFLVLIIFRWIQYLHVFMNGMYCFFFYLYISSSTSYLLNTQCSKMNL